MKNNCFNYFTHVDVYGLHFLFRENGRFIRQCKDEKEVQILCQGFSRIAYVCTHFACVNGEIKKVNITSEARPYEYKGKWYAVPYKGEPIKSYDSNVTRPLTSSVSSKIEIKGLNLTFNTLQDKEDYIASMSDEEYCRYLKLRDFK